MENIDVNKIGLESPLLSVSKGTYEGINYDAYSACSYTIQNGGWMSCAFQGAKDISSITLNGSSINPNQLYNVKKGDILYAAISRNSTEYAYFAVQVSIQYSVN